MPILDLSKLGGTQKGTGALTPNLNEKEAVKNYRIEELLNVAAGVSFSPTSPELWKVYPKRNQAQSGTCVAQTVAKMAGILREQKTGEFVEYSATPIYQKRVNKPSGGMVGVDALDIWRKDGITIESLVPSQNMSDAQVDAEPVNQYEKDIAGISKLDAFVVLPTRNFDLALSTLLATNKPLMVWHQWDYAEWDITIPTIKSTKQLGLSTFEGHHSTTLTKNIGTYQDKQGTTTEDSWGNVGIGGMGVRWLTREFYNARNTFAAYPTTFKTYQEMGIDPAKPQHRFTRNMEYGARLDAEVVWLQKCLQYEGLFPANWDATGNYLEVTRKAVLDFQNKHGVPTDGLNGTLAGTKTRTALNELYAP